MTSYDIILFYMSFSSNVHAMFRSNLTRFDSEVASVSLALSLLGLLLCHVYTTPETIDTGRVRCWVLES